MSKLHVLNHPILKYKLEQLRDKATSSAQFRQLIREMSGLITYEATRDLFSNQEPLPSPVIVAIMRAGNEMLEGVFQILPEASAGHIGIYRDRFINNTVEYYFRLPQQVKDKPIFLLDPILATGDTMLACVDRLRQFNVGPIIILSILVSQQGVENFHSQYPEVEIYAVAIDNELTDKGFLIPGIGDVGNRLYGTMNA